MSLIDDAIIEAVRQGKHTSSEVAIHLGIPKHMAANHMESLCKYRILSRQAMDGNKQPIEDPNSGGRGSFYYYTVMGEST